MAVGLAAAGVAVLTVGHGRLPWIALALAVSFGLYGLARKTVGADAVVGLLWETGLLAPLAAAWLASLEARGSGAFGPTHPGACDLLALGGVVTAVPLVLFAQGARSLPLSTVGLLQYLSPSIQFLLAVLVYREPFTAAHAAAFACIWCALAVLTWDLRRRLRHERAAAPRSGLESRMARRTPPAAWVPTLYFAEVEVVNDGTANFGSPRPSVGGESEHRVDERMEGRLLDVFQQFRDLGFVKVQELPEVLFLRWRSVHRERSAARFPPMS